MPSLDCVEPTKKRSKLASITSKQAKDPRPITRRSRRGRPIQLPKNVVYEIARHLDELEIRHMMESCMILRAGSKRALQPYLDERWITLDPLWYSVMGCECKTLESYCA
jgi:hypothetical protein